MSNWKELQARLNAYQAGTPDTTEEGPDMIQLPVGRAGNPGMIGPVGPTVAPLPSMDEMLTPDEFVSPITMRDILEAPVEHSGNQNYTDQAIREGYGQSRFDTRSGYTPGTNWEDRRAREQSAAGKILNGIAKGAVTAADTFLDTTLGTVFGAAYAFSPLSSLWGISPSESLEAFATNPVSEKINKVTRLAEDWFPNYRTEEEQSDDYQQNWYKPRNFFSANNIGDGILKNFGFTVGAMAGGLTWGKLLGFGKASQLSDDIMKGVTTAAEGDAEAANALKQLAPQVRDGVTKANASQFAQNAKRIARRQNLLPMSQQLAGSLIAAAGEGKTEGLMARDEFLEDYLPRLQQETNEAYANAEQELLQNPNFQMRIYNPDDPTAEPEIMLNTEGQIALQKRQNEIFELFRRKQQEAYNQADDLATLTFALNIPILTGSNAIQFGRMLGGGWRSARQAAGRIRGRARFENGAPVADYRGIGRAGVVARTISNLGKLGGTEAAEEMLQGTVSSGAKQIADDRLTAFHDLGYDRDSMNNFRDAFSSFIQGGTDYLGDWKNWQEGALGALTGLLGMPGRGYIRGERGGIPAAIAEGREGVDKINETAQKLNDYVNSEAFQNRYRNWIRHDALNAQVNRAAEEDNEYAYHTADDALLVNDIIMFSDAGRLDDLKMIADRFSRLSDDDIADARQMLSSESGEEMQETDEQVKERVEKQAAKLQQAIKDYTEIEENTRARLPMGASSDILKETVFTEMQMKNFENRFLTLLGETIDGLDPILYAKTDGNKTAAERKAEVVQMQQDYAQIFSGNLVPISEAKRKETTEKLNTLESMVKGNPEMEQKVRDMRKLSEDRQKFYEKAVTLQKTSPEDFNEEAQSEEKVVAEAEKQASKEESDGMTSLDAVRSAYIQARDSRFREGPEFIARMRKVRKDNPYVNEFLNIHDTWDRLSRDIIQSNGRNDTALDIARGILETATDESDVVNPANIPSFAAYTQQIRDRIARDSADVESMLQATMQSEISEEAYNNAAQMVLQSMQNITNTSAKTTGAVQADEKLKQVQQQKKAQPAVPAKPKPVVTEDSTAKEPPQPGSEAQKPKAQMKVASLDADGQSATDAANNVWTVGETVHFWDDTKKNVTDSREGVVTGFKVQKNGDVKMEVDFGERKQMFSLTGQLHSIHKMAPAGKAVEDATGTERPDVAPDVVDPVKDDLNDELAMSTQYVENPVVASSIETQVTDEGDADYFQLAIPEYPVEDVAVIRGSEASERVEKIRNLRPLAEKVPDFQKVANYLTQNRAAKNTAEAKVGDVVHFKYDPALGMYNGKPQMVMYVERDGEQQVLNVMRRNGRYAGLNAFWNQVMKEFKNENTPFTFSKTSTIWAKRPGFLIYNSEDSNRRNKPINNLEGYNPNAPIVWFNRDGVPKVIRGNRNVVDNIYTWSNEDPSFFRENGYAGRMYYLADDGADGYIPVRLSQLHFNTDTYNDQENASVSKIRGKLNEIRDAANRFFVKMLQAGDDAQAQQKALAESNAELHEIISNLKGNTGLLLANKMFSFGVSSAGPNLSFIRNYKEGENGTQEDRYDRVYIADTQIDQLEDIIAGENWAFDFKVDRNEQRAGIDMPMTRANLEEYINSDLLLTNATSLIPRNVDAYLERWDPKTDDFKKSHSVETSSNTPAENGVAEQPAPSAFRSVASEPGDFGPMERFDDIDRSVFDVGPAEVMNPESAWDNFNDAGKAQLEKRGITKEKFEAMSPEEQNHWIECFGV